MSTQQFSTTLTDVITRPTAGFLDPKYHSITSIAFEFPDLVSPEDEADAAAIFEALPDGFVKDWRWGLGIHKIYKPVIDMVGRAGTRPTRTRKNRLLISSSRATHIADHEYVLNLDHYARIRRGLQRIQASHQRAALLERETLAYDSMLSDQDPVDYPILRPRYKAGTVSRVVQGPDVLARLSKSDRSALLSAVEGGMEELSVTEPRRIVKLQKTIQVATLAALIGNFRELLERATSAERDWQVLLRENPFLLSLVFGFPTVLIAEQANVGGMTIDGDGARYADFLLENEVTKSLALVEIKRPSTSLVSEGEYAGMRNISGDLTRAVMQVLDQRLRLLTNLSSIKMNSPGRTMEGWFVSCVVIAGRGPRSAPEAKSVEIYRNSLKDVVILTFDELLSRLTSLHAYLRGGSPGAESEGTADPVARRGGTGG